MGVEQDCGDSLISLFAEGTLGSAPPPPQLLFFPTPPAPISFPTSPSLLLRPHSHFNLKMTLVLFFSSHYSFSS